jgi:hypothetical protein
MPGVVALHHGERVELVVLRDGADFVRLRCAETRSKSENEYHVQPERQNARYFHARILELGGLAAQPFHFHEPDHVSSY